MKHKFNRYVIIRSKKTTVNREIFGEFLGAFFPDMQVVLKNRL